jgi:hypothetical protein
MHVVRVTGTWLVCVCRHVLREPLELPPSVRCRHGELNVCVCSAPLYISVFVFFLLTACSMHTLRSRSVSQSGSGLV